MRHNVQIRSQVSQSVSQWRVMPVIKTICAASHSHDIEVPHISNLTRAYYYIDPPLTVPIIIVLCLWSLTQKRLCDKSQCNSEWHYMTRTLSISLSVCLTVVLYTGSLTAAAGLCLSLCDMNYKWNAMRYRLMFIIITYYGRLWKQQINCRMSTASTPFPGRQADSALSLLYFTPHSHLTTIAHHKHSASECN